MQHNSEIAEQNGDIFHYKRDRIQSVYDIVSIPKKKGWLATAWRVANETGTVKVTVWTILTIIMSAFGGWLFAAVEGPNHERIRIEKFEQAKERLTLREKYLEEVVQDVINLDSNPSITLDSKPDAIRSALENYEKLMKVDTSKPELERDPWTPLNSIFFTASLFTMIGFGGRNFPITTAGRICTMVYSILTIPILLAMTSDLGLVVFQGIYWVWWRTKKLLSIRKKKTSVSKPQLEHPIEGEETTEQTEPELKEEPAEEAGSKPRKKQKDKLQTGENIVLRQQEEATFPVSMGLLMSAMSLLLSSEIIQFYEPTWNFFDANYYIITSFLTIGLGDVSPSAPKNGPESTLIPHIVLLIFSMTFIGMSQHVLSKRIEFSYALIVHGIHMEFRSRQQKGEDEADDEKPLSAAAEIDNLAKKLSFFDRLYYKAMDSSRHRLLIDLWKRKANMKTEEIQVALPKRDIGLQHLVEVDDITPVGDWKPGEDYGLPVKIPPPENPYIKYLYNLD